MHVSNVNIVIQFPYHNTKPQQFIGYAQINPHFAGYIPRFSCSAPSTLPVKTAFNDEFCHWFYHTNPPGTYGYALPGFHVLLTYDAVTLFLKAWDQRDKTFSPYWQAIDKQLPVTPFDGVSGHIQYTPSTDFHPISKSKQFKPIYMACTDNTSETHIVAGYHVEHQSLSDPGILHEDSFSQAEVDKCIKA